MAQKKDDYKTKSNQTAVEWLLDRFISSNEPFQYKHFEQAKQMEKEQIEQAKAEGYEIATSEAIKEIHKNYRPI